jgi:hypothetical protein
MVDQPPLWRHAAIQFFQGNGTLHFKPEVNGLTGYGRGGFAGTLCVCFEFSGAAFRKTKCHGLLSFPLGLFIQNCKVSPSDPPGNPYASQIRIVAEISSDRDHTAGMGLDWGILIGWRRAFSW